jgi:DNA adenine methylase
VTAVKLRAPFPYFGGKSKIADMVWQRLGKVKHYLEPFAGSLAVLLGCPAPALLEVVGDADHNIANFWRSVQHQPEAVARWADQPVVHVELTARHRWLTEPARVAELRAKLLDAEWPGDAQAAGWWVWGQSSWIGSGWCDVRESDQVPHISDAGMGVGKGVAISDVMTALAERLRHVRVINGDWTRGMNMHYGTNENGRVGVFLDPPYRAFEARYFEATPVADGVAAWARENGENPQVRIALCGHAGDYDLPDWDAVPWSRPGNTYGSSKTKDAECVWFSPHCLRPDTRQLGLFAV